MRIRAKNFEIIDELDLELNPGLTVITGASNNGKSSLIRLLRSLIYNLNSDASIQQGEDSYTIGIIDGENKVIVKRDVNAPNKTVYSVNGKILKKVGRNPVPEVEDALNIKLVDINKKKMELNFLKQMNFPFLLGESGGFIYDFLANSSNQTDFTDLIKTMKSDLKEASDNKKHLEGQVDILKDMYTTSKDTYEKLEPITSLVNDIIAFDSKIQYLQKLESSINSLEYSDKGIIEANAKLNLYLGEYNILKDLDATINEYNKVLALQELITNIDAINNKIMAHNITLEGLNVLVGKLDLDILEDMQAQLKSLDSARNELNAIINNINNIVETQDTIKSLIESNDKALTLLNNIFTLNTEVSQSEANKNELSNLKDSILSLVDKLESETLNNNKYKSSLLNINASISEFDVCPVCGSQIKEGI